jgi:hypothetical protein
MLCRHLHLVAWFVLVLCFATAAHSQELVPTGQASRTEQLFDEESKVNNLRCKVVAWGPSLGFDLAYGAGFIVEIGSTQLPVDTNLRAFIRVTPADRPPALLSTIFKVPPAPRGEGGQRFNFVFSGDFAVGEGKYKVELLLIDSVGRRKLTRWQLKTGSRSDRSQIGPLTVAATPLFHWDGKMDPNGARLTVLLDATETSTNATRLGAGTSVYLLSVLSTVLRNVPCRSVQVVAFNLDQQLEVFRADHFTPSGFVDLASSLRDFQSAMVPVGALRSSAWREFLLEMTKREVTAKEPPDALIFIGVPSHFVDAPALPKFDIPDGTRIFDFEYLKTIPLFTPGLGLYEGDYRNIPDDDGANFAPKALKPFPDAIDRLTRELRGTVFHITSPADLRLAIEKMRTQFR